MTYFDFFADDKSKRSYLLTEIFQNYIDKLLLRCIYFAYNFDSNHTI